MLVERKRADLRTGMKMKSHLFQSSNATAKADAISGVKSDEDLFEV